MLGVLTGERADKADRATVELAELVQLDPPARPGELPPRPSWLEATSSEAAERGDLFRVA